MNHRGKNMQIIKGKDFSFKNTCVTIGKFDGVHIGHQSILNEMAKYGDNLKTVVLTFDFSYFMSDGEERIESYEDKIST